MPRPVPTPVAAAIGIVPAVVAHARHLPVKAVQLPVFAVSSALTAMDTVRREYDDLADRGERLLARLRGTAIDELEDAVDDAVSAHPFAGAYDGHVEDAQAPKGAPTPRATEPSTVRVDSAATPEVVEVADAVSAFSGAAAVNSHEDLPLPDYDHMTLGSLRGRLRSLEVPQLVQLRDYEKAHADRLPVVTMLDNRIAKLATDAAATPSPGGPGTQVTPTGSTAPGKVAGTSAARTGGAPHTKVRTT